MNTCKRNILVGFMMIMIFVALTANGAMADTAVYKNYARLEMGVNQPTGDLDDLGYDAGFNIAGAYGRYLNKYLVVEGGIGSFFSDQDIDGRTTLTGNYDREDLVSAFGLTGTVKGEIPVGPVRLFAGAGVGIYLVGLDSDIDTVRLGDFSANDSDTVFGTHIVVGGYYNITPRVFVGLDGMYRWTTDFDLKDTVVTIPVEVEGDLNGYTICFTGGFRF